MKRFFGFKPVLCQLLAAALSQVSAQTFPNIGPINDFADSIVETPNTAMEIEPTNAPIAYPNEDAPGGENPETGTPPGEDHNPVGVTGVFGGVSTTGCAYNVLSHNATRQIDDIVVPGSIGKYPLKMTRYYNSRRPSGMAPGWSHEYAWGISSHQKVEYPNGNEWDNTCASSQGFPGPLGVSDGWQAWACGQNGCAGDFRLADGGIIHFDQSNGFLEARTIKDPYGQTTTLTYYDSGSNLGLLKRVTEPGGRYLEFSYNASYLVSRVDANDGRGNLIDWVVYHYTPMPPGGGHPSVNCLTTVDYSDDTHAKYTYTEDNVPEDLQNGSIKVFPLVSGCDDRRYDGPMRRIAYVYQDRGPHGAIRQERYWDGVHGSEGTGALVSKIEPDAPSPITYDPNFETTYTETRGDGNVSRRFTYTELHLARSHSETDPCPRVTRGPAPQQFLQTYTDFKIPANSTQLGYDNNWYVNSVTDANNHRIDYDRGPSPYASSGPKGIGQITKISYPADGSHVDYGYSDESPNLSGHYLTSISEYTAGNQLRSQTIHQRDPTTHKIYQTDYKGENGIQLARETFTYCDQPDGNQCGPANPATGQMHGQIKTHQLKNGAYVHYRYDSLGRGLLTDKWEPTSTSSASETEPKTHYDYYTGADGKPGWIGRVMKVTGPRPNWEYSQQASETYEYDRKSDGTACAGRGLVTMITHADNRLQSFGYNQWGNKVQEWNEMGERTHYSYDDYNRVTSVLRNMYGTAPDEVTTYRYTGTPYKHTSNSPDMITAPTGIVTTNDYDQNFRKTSTSVAGRTTWFHYDAVGNLDCATDPRGSGPCISPLQSSPFTTRTEYDARNRKWHVWDAQDHLTTFTYDCANNVTRIDRPDSNWEEKTYDGLNRLTTNTVSFNASLSLTTWLVYNRSGTIQKVVDARGTVGQTYPSGDPNYTTSFLYNASDQKTRMTYPDGSWQSFEYDDAHNMKRRKTVAGKWQDFGYDNRNRYCGKAWENADEEWVIFGYDGASRLGRAVNGGWDQNLNAVITSDVHRGYDHAGRLTLDQQAVTGLQTKNVNYVYDVTGARASAGNPTRVYVTNPNGSDAGHDYDFTYDDMGRLEKILVHSTSSPAFQYFYDDASNETKRQNMNGVLQIYNPDSLNRPTTARLQHGTDPLIATEVYGYYDVGRLHTVTRGNRQDQIDYYRDGELQEVRYGVNTVEALDPNATPPADDPTKEKTVDDFVGKSDGMDPSALDTGPRTVTYFYDKAGNRQSVTDNGTSWPYGPNRINQYETVQGSTIQNGSHHEITQYQRTPNDPEPVNYRYIKDEHLISVSTPTKNYGLAYDALGRCVKRTLTVSGQPNMTTFYIYDGEKPIMEYRLNDLSRPAKNLYGKGVDEILMRYDPSLTQNQTFYYQQDHEGSVIYLTKPDGTPLERYKYDVFGAPTIYDNSNPPNVRTASVVSNRFMFTGREYAAAFGFYEYRARAYHPGLGRFMSEDPKLFDAGDYNLFRYCHNDPTDFTDPMGLEVGFAESLIPFWGSAHMAYDAFNEGHYGWAAFHAAMAVTDVSGVKALGSAALKAGFKSSVRTGLATGVPRVVEHEATTGYRYVGRAEANTIRETGRIPTVNANKNPKVVFFTNEKFTAGNTAKDALSLDNKPAFRVEFNLQQAPAGYGGLTNAGHVEFTLREGAQPIQANKIVPLDDASPLELDIASRHTPPKLGR